MPTYTVIADGRTIDLTGDAPPTEGELEMIFGQLKMRAEAPSHGAASAPEMPAPGMATQTLGQGVSAAPTQAFPTAESDAAKVAAIPALSAGEAAQLATTPFASLPRPPESMPVARAIADPIESLAEQTLLMPASGLLDTAMLLPGLRTMLGALFTASAAKHAAQRLGEASVTGNKADIAGGVTEAALAGLGGLGVGVDIARSAPVGELGALGREQIIPQTTAALREVTKPEPNPPLEPPADNTSFGIVHPGTLSFLQNLRNSFVEPMRKMASDFSIKKFMQRALPNVTEADREAGEAGVRFAVANQYGEGAGLEFAKDVLGNAAEQDPQIDLKLGVALKEDRLRGIASKFKEQASEARAQAEANPNNREALLEDAQMFDNASNNVVSFIGGEGSPFKTEAEYQDFLGSPLAKDLIARYKQLHLERKEPLYREAADIDPYVELVNPGLQTGTHINLTFADEGTGGVKGRTGTGTPIEVRQLGTLLRRDPFARQAMGTSTLYTPSFTETMKQAFAREYPVAAQHEFVRKLLESGIASEGESPVPPTPDMKSYALRLRPWTGRFLYVPKKLAGDLDPILGQSHGWHIPVLTPAASVLTRQSIIGLGEGSAHSANILLKLFTGITTSHPLAESVASALPFRPDVIYSVAKSLLRGLRPDSRGMLALTKIGAAKQPYTGAISSKFLNPLDKGVRLISSDVYDGLAERGVVPSTETGKREFVNEIGNYTTSLQSEMVRGLRTSHIQPFATGFRTAKVQAIKRLGLSPGMEATSPVNAAMLRTAIASKFVGTAATVATMNWLLNRNNPDLKTMAEKMRGLPGTRIGSISWVGKDDKTHEFDAAGLLGATSGARALGLMSTLESKERGVDTGTALSSGARSIGTTLMSQVAGPGVRAATIGVTGHDPYGRQIADVKPPSDNLLESQVAANVIAAAKSVNPFIDTITDIQSGKPMDEIMQRQLTRYATRTPSGVQQSDNFAQIVTRARLNEYADWMSTQARKLDRTQRLEWTLDRLDKDNVEGGDRKQVLTEMKRKGTFKFE